MISAFSEVLKWKTVIDGAGKEVGIAVVKNPFRNCNGVKKK